MKRRDTLTKYLYFSFAVVLIYTVIEFVVSLYTGISHDTITTCLYAFFGTEIGACAFIQIVKTRKKGDADSSTEELDHLEVNADDVGG